MARRSARRRQRWRVFRGFARPPLWGSIALGVGIALFAGLLVLEGIRSPVGPQAGSPPAVEPTASSPAAPAAPSTAVVRPAALATVLALGDGITAGQGSTGSDAGYVALAEAAILTPDTWDVQAFTGGTLDSVLERAALPAKTDAVLVALGTNDWGVTPAAAFAPAYLDRLARLRERYPEALFICVGVWQSPTQPETVGYDDAVRAGCTSVSGRFVPLSDLYADPANHQAGQADANPADAGYRLVADRVVAVLRGG